MTDRVFKGLDEFLARGVKELGAKAAKVSTEVTTQVRDRGLELSKQVAPVGGKLTRDRHPGQLRDSLKPIEEDGAAKVVSDVPYGGVINRGRKRGITPQGQKRVRAKRGEKVKPNPKAKMLGSPQAPRGITRPVRQRLAKELPAIVEKAVAKVGG